MRMADPLPAVRLRRRSLGGVGWRVLECGEGTVTTHPDTVLAQVLAGIRSTEPARQRAA